MGSTTTYHSLEELGVPHGELKGNPILMAQDEFTREYHTVDSRVFHLLCTGEWEKDAVMNISYSGNIALVDPATQIVAHIYDDEKTTLTELESFERLMAQEIIRQIGGKRGK